LSTEKISLQRSSECGLKDFRRMAAIIFSSFVKNKCICPVFQGIALFDENAARLCLFRTKLRGCRNRRIGCYAAERVHHRCEKAAEDCNRLTAQESFSAELNYVK